MPLNKIKLEKELLDFLTTNNNDVKKAAKILANIIDSYVRSATVTVSGTASAPPGIPTAGTPAAQTTIAPVISTVTGTGTIT